MRIAKVPAGPYVLKADELAPNVPALAGVEITVLPVEPAMYLAAREAMRRVYASLLPDLAYATASDGGDDEPVSPDDMRALEKAQRKAMQAFTLEFASMAITGWNGVDDEAGTPLPLTVDGMAQAFSAIELYDFFDQTYVRPVRMMDAEKNASAPSRNGTSGAKIRAKRTAATAPRHARTAPTPSTPRKRRTAKSPGKA